MSTGESGGSRADGITFLVTGDGEAVPFLAYEADEIVSETPEGSPDPIDAVVSLYLGKGFELVAGPLTDQRLPTLSGWLLKADAEGVTLWDDLGVIAFIAGRGEIDDEWVNVVNDTGWCRVLTGTNLGIRKGNFFGTVDDAISGGRVVAADVATSTEMEHPR
jgi:hypothetical protein